jgi:hypothetical protein
VPDSPTSTLKTPRDRFLSLFLAHARKHDWLTAEQVVEEFPPSAIMTALESADALRARILVELAGVHAKIAPKKSVTAAGEDLQIALDEKICEPQKLLELFDCDEQVRYLPADKLWALATRDEFWNVPTDKARQRVLDVLQTALDEDLIDVKKLIAAIGVDRLLAELPKELLEKSLSDAIRLGLEGKPFDYVRLLFNCPLSEWAQHVALDHLWQRAVVGEILPACGLGTGSGGSAAGGNTAGGGKNTAPMAKPAPTKSSAPPASEPVVELPAADLEPSHSSPTTAVPPSGDRRREEVAARDKALDNLRRLDRSPRDADKLSTPLLLAIDAMYVDLLQLGDDEAREECIRDAFPNEKLLEEALYAMAEALDPKLDEQELRTKVPTLESLIQLVLYEERKRASGLASRSSSPPPGILPEGMPTSGITAGAPPLPPSRRSIPPAPLPPPARKLS